MAEISLDRYLNRITERVHENKKDISQKNKQRRTGFVDLYGVEYTRQGDSGSPATFYISVSPDLDRYERFEFKLDIQPFVSTVSEGGISSVEVQVNTTGLTVEQASGSGTHSHGITPNPHTHTTKSHSHNVTGGITFTHTTADDFEISIEGVDITDYLIEQQDGDWIDGEGLYPSSDLESDQGFYDILAVASVMQAEGRSDLVEKILKPGFKKVAISSNAPFQVTLINYLKYSHINR